MKKSVKICRNMETNVEWPWTPELERLDHMETRVVTVEIPDEIVAKSPDSFRLSREDMVEKIVNFRRKTWLELFMKNEMGFSASEIPEDMEEMRRVALAKAEG